MTRSLTRTLPRLVVTGALVSTLTAPFGLGFGKRRRHCGRHHHHQDTATASYTDGNGNALQHRIEQRRDVRAELAVGRDQRTPARRTSRRIKVVVDPFVITNTGNGSGNFTGVTGTIGTGTSTGTGSLVGYTLANDANCTVAAPCSAAQLQTDLQTAAYLTGARRHAERRRRLQGHERGDVRDDAGRDRQHADR